MIGIVIVSHSADLAKGLKALAEQMGQGKLRIAAAGGVDDPDDPIGTDAMKILSAIQDVYSDDGVLVFMDMGSAILSTEMALDFLEEDQKEKIVLSGAPVVEGVIAATVTAAGGATIESVQKEVTSALHGKRAQLGIETEIDDAGSTPVTTTEEREEPFDVIKQYRLNNALGLHARPAAKVASIVSGYDATVQFRNVSAGSGWVNAESLNRLITLKAGQGDELELRAGGHQANEVFHELDPLLSESFYESSKPPESKPGRKKSRSGDGESAIPGLSVGSGVAMGPVFLLDNFLPEVQREVTDEPEKEVQRFEQSLNQSMDELEEMKNSGARDSEIFDAHIFLLKDPEWIDDVKKAIREESVTAAFAWKESLDTLIAEYRKSGSEVVADRAADLLDVGGRVLGKLMDLSESMQMPETPSILAAEELTPSIVSTIEPDIIEGIVTAKGSATSHSAILVRSLGLPAVFNTGKRFEEIRKSKHLIVDGTEGVVIPDPDHKTLTGYQEKKKRWEVKRTQAEEIKNREFTDDEGNRIFIEANIATPEEADAALKFGAEGVGLFRTEFLYMNGTRPPSEEAQAEAYRAVLKKMNGRPVTFRTVDIGGDKPISYLNIDREENPFLGWRGIRYSLEEIDLFKTQLRALLRASADGKAKIMFPMVSTPEEFTEACSVLEKVQQELSKQGIPFDPDIPVGMMVEVPAAVIRIDEFLEIADFISIGTNDLTQYVMAADRNNSKVSELASYHQPAVLHVIEQTIRKANELNVPVSMCGEMAGDSKMTKTLLDFGLRSYSMNATGIPEFKLYLDHLLK